MVQYLKKAEPQSRQDTRALSERVRAMLDYIEQNRDAAVRRYARDLDRWEQPEFRVSEAEIAAELFARYPGRDQAQARNAEWSSRTGKSPDTLYRRERELREQVER